MRIFITGGTGFLGKSILQQLSEYNYFIYKRGSNIIEDLDNFKPNIIIHSAAEIYKEELMFESNIKLTHNILEWVKENNAKLIYFGSSSEYGKVLKPMNEDDECLPCSVYGYTKYIGTLKCQEYARKYKKDIVVLRPFSVYGPNEPEHRLIPTLYNNIISGKPITLIDGVHDFIHIEDFIQFVDRIIHSTNTGGEIFNVGRGTSYTNKEVFEKMANTINSFGRHYDVDITYIPERKKQDSEIWVCDITKMLSLPNFKFKYDLDSGLKQYIIYKNDSRTKHNEW